MRRPYTLPKGRLHDLDRAVGARVRLGDLPAVDAQPRARRSVLLVVAEDNRLHGPPSGRVFSDGLTFFG